MLQVGNTIMQVTPFIKHAENFEKSNRTFQRMDEVRALLRSLQVSYNRPYLGVRIREVKL